MAKIETIRHSLAHILALAVQELYPKTKLGMGPAIENGFYYDFEFMKQGKEKRRIITPKELSKIERKMKQLIKENILFKKQVVTKEKAKKIFRNQPYKLELIKEFPGNKVTVYQSGNFIDLCRGPHIKSTKEINPDTFCLSRIAGAYWRGSEKNPMLTRIYGLAFQTKEDLDNYFKIKEEAEKRDHRLIGQKMELFLLDEEVGAGLPLWMPKGAIIRKLIEDYLYKELLSQNYQWVVTPHIGKLDLWKTSGHWNLYRENMYPPMDIEGEKYELKPMNCPFHVKIYQSKLRSYKDLPIKYAEFGTVYRYEKSGTLHGLTRVRGFTQDDAHIWCTPTQLPVEIEKLIKHGLKILKTFGFGKYEIFLSTRPQKYAGTERGWKKAMNVLEYILKKLKLKYSIDPGGGVFYGPKIDIKIKDNLGREWQCTTIQVDFNLPERFHIAYINQKGKKETPYMIHRALLGSIERFIGVLIENYGGALPFWLAPEQAWVIPIGSNHKKYAQEVGKELRKNGIRTQVKMERETLSKKIREGEIQKIPYILVIGDKEIKKKGVRVRKRERGDIGMVKLNKLIKEMATKIIKKS